MEDTMNFVSDSQKYYDWQSDKEAFEYEVEQSLSDDSIKGLFKDGFILDRRRKLKRPVISDFNLHNVFIIYLASCKLRDENKLRRSPKINNDAMHPFLIFYPYLRKYFNKYCSDFKYFSELSCGEAILGLHVAGIKIVFKRERGHVYANIDNFEKRCTILRSIKILEEKLGLL